MVRDHRYCSAIAFGNENSAIALRAPVKPIALLSIKNNSDPVWSGLAWTLLTGMLTSSALTLFIIPLMYYGDQRSSRKPEATPVNEKQLVTDN